MWEKIVQGGKAWDFMSAALVKVNVAQSGKSNDNRNGTTIASEFNRKPNESQIRIRKVHIVRNSLGQYHIHG